MTGMPCQLAGRDLRPASVSEAAGGRGSTGVRAAGRGHEEGRGRHEEGRGRHEGGSGGGSRPPPTPGALPAMTVTASRCSGRAQAAGAAWARLRGERPRGRRAPTPPGSSPWTSPPGGPWPGAEPPPPSPSAALYSRSWSGGRRVGPRGGGRSPGTSSCSAKPRQHLGETRRGRGEPGRLGPRGWARGLLAGGRAWGPRRRGGAHLTPAPPPPRLQVPGNRAPSCLRETPLAPHLIWVVGSSLPWEPPEAVPPAQGPVLHPCPPAPTRPLSLVAGSPGSPGPGQGHSCLGSAGARRTWGEWWWLGRVQASASRTLRHVTPGGTWLPQLEAGW